MSFAARLQTGISKSGKSQKQVCDEVGLSPAGLYNYLQGKRSPDLDVALLLARACGVSLAYLVGEIDESGERPLEPALPPVPIKTSVFTMMGRTPEDLAEDVDAAPKQVRDWIAGKSQPTHSQLIRLFNEVVKSVAAIKAAKDAETASPHHRPGRKKAA